MFDRLYRGLMNLVGSGTGKVISDAGDFQIIQLQMSPIETKDNAPRLTDYGFQSYPPDDHTALMLSVGGLKTKGVIIATHHPKSRVRNLKPGEAVLSDDQGQMVYLMRSGIKMVDKAGSIFTLNGDGTGTITLANGLVINANTQINGTLNATGNIISDAEVADQGGAKTMAAMRAVHNDHDHDDPHGGVVSPPNQEM